MKRIVLFLTFVLLLSGFHAFAVNIDSLKSEITKQISQSQDERQKRLKDSIMLSRLSPKDLMTLKTQELELERLQIAKDGRTEMPLNGAGIVLICMLPFILVISIIVVNTRSRSAESKRRYNLYMKSLEMGQTVPEYFFVEPEKKANPASNLKKGILWLMIGLGIIVGFWVVLERKGLIFGIIPAFIGAGFLLVHFLEKPKSVSDTNSNEQHG